MPDVMPASVVVPDFGPVQVRTRRPPFVVGPLLPALDEVRPITKCGSHSNNELTIFDRVDA